MFRRKYLKIKSNFKFSNEFKHFEKSNLIDCSNIEYKYILIWNFISRNENINNEFINKYKDVLNWNLLLKFQILNEKTIKQNIKFINPKLLSETQILSEKYKII